MSDTRAALEEAFEQAELDFSESEAEPEVEPEAELETDAEAPQGDSEPEDEPEPEPEPEDEPEPEPEPEAAVTASEPVTAPQSWRPEAREAWTDIPPAAQAEIQRREQDIEKKLGELSDRSRVAKRFDEVVKPFEQTIALEANGDALAATQNLMGVATRLRFGSKQEKAALLGMIVQQYDVDIEALDTALANNLSSGGGGFPNLGPSSEPPPAADPRVDQMWQRMQHQEQTAKDDRAAEVQRFIASKEWGEDVRDDMADLMELASRRGETLTLEQAYDRAVSLRSDIHGIMQQRKANAGGSQESLKRKKRAAAQIRGGTATPTQNNTPTTLEAALTQAWDDVANRG